MKLTHQFPKSRSDIVAMFKEAGITPTHQRIKIAEVLFSRTQHLSAEEVLVEVNEGGEEVSKATVYNTLGLFAKHGLVREVIVDPSKVFYDSNLCEHHHLYYSDSGKLEDITADQIEVTKLPELPDGIEIEEVDVIIRVHHS